MNPLKRARRSGCGGTAGPSGWWQPRVLGALVLGAGVIGLALADLGGGVAPSTPPLGPQSAPDTFCGLTTTASRRTADGWQIAVQVAHADATALLFVADGREIICLANRDANGRYTGGISATGRLFSAASGLTFDTGLAPAPTGTTIQLLAGRVPPGTARVLLVTAAGDVPASLGHGHYLAWLTSRAYPSAVRALDAYGRALADLPLGPTPTAP